MRPLCKVVKAHRDGATGSETADSDRHGKNAQISDRPCSAKAVQGHTITAAQRPDSRCIRRREAPFGGQQGQEMQHDERGNHKPCIATAARGGATFRCTSIPMVGWYPSIDVSLHDAKALSSPTRLPGFGPDYLYTRRRARARLATVARRHGDACAAITFNTGNTGQESTYQPRRLLQFRR